MFPIDPLWIYIFVPTALVTILVLIKLKQEKVNKQVENTPTEEGEEQVRPPEGKVIKEDLVELKSAETKPKSPEEKGPENCPHYLGYLYMRKGHNSTCIPSECYGCRKLLSCLYSRNVIEKVYGE